MNKNMLQEMRVCEKFTYSHDQPLLNIAIHQQFHHLQNPINKSYHSRRQQEVRVSEFILKLPCCDEPRSASYCLLDHYYFEFYEFDEVQPLESINKMIK